MEIFIRKKQTWHSNSFRPPYQNISINLLISIKWAPAEQKLQTDCPAKGKEYLAINHLKALFMGNHRQKLNLDFTKATLSNVQKTLQHHHRVQQCTVPLSAQCYIYAGNAYFDYINRGNTGGDG